jgi:FKBP-type peptidyl-prolyl cis-trans isomerase
MTNVVISSAARTAIGSHGRSLKDLPPTELGAIAVRGARRLLAFALVSLAVAGCGSDDFDQTVTVPAGAESTPTATPTAAATPEGSKNLKDTKKKPLIPKPTGDPPKKLVIKDIVKGKGKAAKKGDEVSVQYAGIAFSTGEEFDASWNRGEPFTFTVGQGSVIKGWDRGVPGMKVGGRRQLTIPAGLAYGAAGQPPSIGPDETLVFVIDLEKVS